MALSKWTVLIGRCRTGHIRYQTRHWSILSMLRTHFRPCSEDADAKREFKYPYLACEIFCCEIDAVFSTLVGPGGCCSPRHRVPFQFKT